MGIFNEEESMRKESTAKSHVLHGFTQFELTNYLLNNLSQFKITPTAKLVFLELSAHYNPNKPDMFPKQKTLAQKIGISERSVVRAISELFKAGLLVVECKNTNRYKFTSKIGCVPPQNEKILTSEKLSDSQRQNDITEDDNLSRSIHEQKRETNKEPLSLEKFRMLKQFATERGAKYPEAYVRALIKNGSASRIVSEIQQRNARGKGLLDNCNNFLEETRRDAESAEPPTALLFELKKQAMQKIERERSSVF